MKKIILFILLSLLFNFNICAQSKEDQSINLKSLYRKLDELEVQGFNIKQKLMYRVHFEERYTSPNEVFKKEMKNENYSFEREFIDNDKISYEFKKIEINTKQSLLEKNLFFKKIADKNNIDIYSQYGPYNIDGTKIVVSDKEFQKYVDSKKGNELYSIALKLHDLVISQDDPILSKRYEIVSKQCVENNIKKDSVYYLIGSYKILNKQKVNEGRNYLLEAIKINPNFKEALWYLAMYNYTNGEYKTALEDLNKIDKIIPNDENVVYIIAASQYQLKLYSESLKNCDRVLQLNKENKNAIELSKLLKEKNITDEIKKDKTTIEKTNLGNANDWEDEDLMLLNNGYKMMLVIAKNKVYDVIDIDGLANYLNENINEAFIGCNNNYKFTKIGIINTSNKSIEFINKNNQLYIKLFLPKNESCEYGFKEFLAIKESKSTRQEQTNNYKFKFDYRCKGETLKFICVKIIDFTEGRSNAFEIIDKQLDLINKY